MTKIGSAASEEKSFENVNGRTVFANSVDPDQTDLGPHCLPVCKNRFEEFARMLSRRHKQTTFSDAGFLGVLSVKSYLDDERVIMKGSVQ